MLVEHAFFSHPLPFTTWPYQFAPGVDPKTRCAIAVHTGAAELEFACVVGDNVSTQLVSGRIDEALLEVTLLTQRDLELEECAVTLDDGTRLTGRPGFWSEACGNYIAFQPGGSKLFLLGALAGAPWVIPLQGCTILDAVDFAGEVRVLAAAGDGSRHQ